MDIVRSTIISSTIKPNIQYENNTYDLVNNNSNKMQLLPIESSSKSFSENSFAKNFPNKFDSHAGNLLIYEKQPIENTKQFESDTYGESNSTEHFYQKSSPKFSNNMQNLFKYYYRKKNYKKDILKNSLNKKIKENVKLKKEIIDLLENVKSSNQTMSHTDENNNLGTEQKKVLIDELNKKENFLSANINRNILALEDFMNSNKKPIDGANEGGDPKNLQSKYEPDLFRKF